MSVRRGARASVPLHSDESFVTVTTRYCRPVPNPTPRIEFIGLNYLPEPTGIAPYTSAMARGLVRRRNSVRVLTAHPHYPDWKIWNGYGQWTRDESTDGVAVRRMRHYVPSRPKGVARLLSEVSFGLRAVFSRWGRPDVIVAVSPGLFASALVALRRCLSLRRVPLVVWVQDLYTIGLAETAQGGGIAVRVSRTVEGWMLRTADHVVVIHDRFASRVSEDFRRASRSHRSGKKLDTSSACGSSGYRGKPREVRLGTPRDNRSTRGEHGREARAGQCHRGSQTRRLTR